MEIHVHPIPRSLRYEKLVFEKFCKVVYAIHNCDLVELTKLIITLPIVINAIGYVTVERSRDCV